LKEPNTTAVVGISGVGKTTAINNLQSRLSAVHLQASDLLKSAFKRSGDTPSSEDLRKGAVLANQNILISEFLRETANETRPIVFDGHIVIDRDPSLMVIPPDVFRASGVRRFVFLRAAPEDILNRRRSDEDRHRPTASIDKIARLQQIALEKTLETGRILELPVFILDQNDIGGLAALV
jgi:adenylate kinase